MTESWLAFGGSLLTFASVAIGAWLNLRSTKRVHTLVNSQHDDLVSRQDQLTGALEDAGVKVPRPVKPPPET